ncbi:TetR/AcrR family transcriptional regulator [Paenibacillus albiflavus]|uniref:TetR/AcrR family transcriptional regulator n=1 Tax=Paenibacillus albiflavus TaxID=2545760 RepID=A0A4R4EKN8_9BACL|nr:TetR/AcrR family transcriptional regulator [Paenibacillus albiflavus]TCZ78855.1 TetR/AcrR family transcriptional regulator [Paenibacillus albiflavus]
MTAKRIKDVALKHFAAYGYSGSSLAHIAEEVGIKKPSLYAHFKGKDDLFLRVLQDAFNEESTLLEQYLTKETNDTLHDRLYQFLVYYEARYEQNERNKFMMRMSFFPPPALYDNVMEYVYAHLDRLEDHLVALFTELSGTGKPYSFDPRQMAKAYLCLLDGVCVERLYGGADRFKQRLEASWNLYWLGLQTYQQQ